VLNVFNQFRSADAEASGVQQRRNITQTTLNQSILTNRTPPLASRRHPVHHYAVQGVNWDYAEFRKGADRFAYSSPGRFRVVVRRAILSGGRRRRRVRLHEMIAACVSGCGSCRRRAQRRAAVIRSLLGLSIDRERFKANRVSLSRRPLQGHGAEPAASTGLKPVEGYGCTNTERLHYEYKPQPPAPVPRRLPDAAPGRAVAWDRTPTTQTATPLVSGTVDSAS